MARRRDGDTDKRIGARLKMIRLERKMSQESLGKALGLTFQQIQKYEKGTNAVASSRIPQLCQALKIKPNDLFTGFVFDPEFIVADGDPFAMTVGVRAQKLGPIARAGVMASLVFFEAHNDAPKKRKPGVKNAASKASSGNR